MDELKFLKENPQQKCSEPLLDAIRELFIAYFDYPWLINIIYELSVNMGNMGSIRSLLALSSVHPLKENIVLNGIAGLKTLVRIINIWLIPESSDILGISPFTNKIALSNRTLRKCLAYTLPVNTMTLSILIAEFEKEIIRESLLTN